MHRLKPVQLGDNATRSLYVADEDLVHASATVGYHVRHRTHRPLQRPKEACVEP